MANVQVDVSFIPNARGGQNLVYRGHKFRFRTTKGERIHWRCCKATCRSTINTLNNLITTYRDCHNHQANNDKIAVDKFLSNLKDLVKTDHRPIPTIYQEELSRVGQEEFVQHIPLYHSADSSLYRSRAKIMPGLPKLRTNINQPEGYQKTTSGEDFVLHSEDDNKFMIFATLDNLRHLAAADTYLCDGTFSTCPSLFYQMYTIHASVHNKIVPLVYALLPDKKQSTYMQLFTILKQKAAERDINLKPRKMMENDVYFT